MVREDWINPPFADLIEVTWRDEELKGAGRSAIKFGVRRIDVDRGKSL